MSQLIVNLYWHYLFVIPEHEDEDEDSMFNRYIPDAKGLLMELPSNEF